MNVRYRAEAKRLDHALKCEGVGALFANAAGAGAQSKTADGRGAEIRELREKSAGPVYDLDVRESAACDPGRHAGRGQRKTVAHQFSTHEDFTRGEAPRGASDRSFGLVFTVAFVLVGLAPLRRHAPVRLWAVGIAVALAIVSWASPQILHPANRAWTKLSLLLNRMVSPVAMGAIFYLVAAPTGIVMRWMGKDPLRLRRDPSADSYWLRRDPPGPAPETMSNQF